MRIKQKYDIAVMDYTLNKIKVFRSVECSDPEDWLWENYPGWKDNDRYFITACHPNKVNIEEVSCEN